MPDPVLVTGAAGFIGSHLCEALLARGERVAGLDNFDPFYAPAEKRRNLEACLADPNFSLWEADIRDPAGLAEVFERVRPGLVVHLAALAGVRPSILDPELYAAVNVGGTVNLLQLCARHAVPKFIFASSSSVYGETARLPFSESDPVDRPVSPYAATKKAGELLCHTWHHLYGISMLCLRFFTVYGPRQRPDLAIRKFAAKLSAGEPIEVYGDGSSSRDYTYVADIVRGVVAALDYLRGRHCCEIVNLGNSHAVSLTEMISSLERVSGLQARLIQAEPQSGDVPRTQADLAKARRLLGYQPQTVFQQGLELFWRWWQSRP